MRYDAVVIDHIPASSPKRTGRAMVWAYITVHNTGNPRSTAANERAYLTDPANTSTTAYHIVVDASQAIECVPLDEVAYHAGDGRNGAGNSQSIGIEICESGDHAANEQAAVELIADLLIRYGWGVDRVQPHQHWSGKYCPRLILPHWADFIARIERQMEVMQMTEVQEWQLVAIRAVCDRFGLDHAYWLAKAGQPLTVGELFGVLNKVARQ